MQHCVKDNFEIYVLKFGVYGVYVLYLFQHFENTKKMNRQKKIIEYRISDLAIRNIKSNIPLMAKLMEHFDRGQRTIENMLDVKDKRFTEPEVIQIIIKESGLYKEQVIEEAVAAA